MGKFEVVKLPTARLAFCAVAQRPEDCGQIRTDHNRGQPKLRRAPTETQFLRAFVFPRQQTRGRVYMGFLPTQITIASALFGTVGKLFFRHQQSQ